MSNCPKCGAPQYFESITNSQCEIIEKRPVQGRWECGTFTPNPGSLCVREDCWIRQLAAMTASKDKAVNLLEQLYVETLSTGRVHTTEQLIEWSKTIDELKEVK